MDGERPCVLVVEDDPDLRDLLVTILDIEGIEAATASNGAEALTYLRTHAHPRLILLDLAMPVMDGWQFRTAQQIDAQLAPIPVVVVTAQTSVAIEALRPADILTKPVDVDVLLATVRRHGLSERC